MSLLSVTVAVLVDSAMEARNARRLAEEYTSIAARLMNPNVAMTGELHTKVGIPPALHSKDIAIIYYLQRAIDLAPRLSGPHFYLGVHLATTDCDLTLALLEREAEIQGGPAGVEKMIQRIREDGDCDSLTTPPEGIQAVTSPP